MSAKQNKKYKIIMWGKGVMKNDRCFGKEIATAYSYNGTGVHFKPHKEGYSLPLPKRWWNGDEMSKCSVVGTPNRESRSNNNEPRYKKGEIDYLVATVYTAVVRCRLSVSKRYTSLRSSWGQPSVYCFPLPLLEHRAGGPFRIPGYSRDLSVKR